MEKRIAELESVPENKAFAEAKAKAVFAEVKAKAESGLAKAQLNLGVMYAKGEGVEQDFKEAVKWSRLAAEQGHAKAQLLNMFVKNKIV